MLLLLMDLISSPLIKPGINLLIQENYSSTMDSGFSRIQLRIQNDLHISYMTPLVKDGRSLYKWERTL